MPHGESEPVRSGSPQGEDISEEAEGLSGPPDPEIAADMERMFWVFSLCFRYPSEEVYLRLRENFRLLERIVGETSSDTPQLPDLQEMQAEYIRLMVNNYGHIPAVPYASCYLHGDGLLMGAVQEEIARIMWEAGYELREDIREPADHIHLLLEFCAATAGALSRGESAHHGYKALIAIVCRYIAPMTGQFCENIREHARQDLYRDLALAFPDFIREMLSLVEGERESTEECEQEESLCHPCS